MVIKGKRVIIFTGALFGLLLLLLIGARFWLTTDHARSLAQTRLNAAIPGRLSWGEFRLSLFSGTFELTDILLKTPSDDAPVAVDRVFVDISWASLLKGELTAETILIQRPRVKLTVDDKGELDLIKAFPPSGDKKAEPSSGGLPFNVKIDSLALTGGSFLYEKAVNDQSDRDQSDRDQSGRDQSERREPGIIQPVMTETVAIRNLSITVGQGNLMEQSADFTVGTGSGEIHMAGMDTGMERFLLQGSLKKGKLAPLSLEIKSELADVALSGTVADILTLPDLNLDLDLVASLPGIRDAFHLEPEMTGPVKLHLEARGTFDDPQGRLTVDYAGGRIAGNGVDRVALALSIRERLIDFEKFDLSAPMGKLVLKGGIDLSKAFSHGFLSPVRDPDAISWQFLLKLDDFALEELVGGTGGTSGTVNSSLKFEGRGVTPSAVSAKAALELSVGKFAMEDLLSPMDMTLRTEAGLENNTVTIRQMELNAGDNRITAKGDYDISGDELSAEMAVDLPDLAAIGLSPRMGGPRGKIALTVNAAGSLKHPGLSSGRGPGLSSGQDPGLSPGQHPGLALRLQGEGLAFSGITIGDLGLVADLTESGTVDISSLTLDNNGSVIRATGSAGIFDDNFKLKPDPSADLSIRFENLDAGNFMEEEICSGTMDGTLTLGGTPADPHGKLAIRGRNMGFKETRVGDVDADLGFARGSVFLDRVQLRNKSSAVEISGTAGVLNMETGRLMKAPSFDLSIAGKRIFLEDFVPGMKGRIALNGHVKGDTEHPEGKISLHGSRLTLGTQKIHGIHMDSRLDGDRVHLESLRLSLAKGEEITGKGWVFPLERRYDLSVASPGILLKHIDGLKDLNPDKGELSLSLSGSGSFDNPRMAGELTVRNLTLKGEPVEDIHVGVELADRIAKISGNPGFDMNARVNLDTRGFEADAEFNRTELSPFFRIAGRSDLNGVLTGTVTAKGTLDAPDRIRADAEVSRIEIFQDRIGLVRGEKIRASLVDREISVPGIRLTLFDKGELYLSGKGRLDGPMDFTVEGSLPMEAAELFTPGLDDLTGDINISAALAGTLKRPDLTADIGLAGVGFAIPGLTQKLHHLDGRLLLTPDAISFDKITGEIDTGSFGISGRVDLAEFQPAGMELTIKAHALPLNIPDTAELLFNTELAVSGSPEKSMIRGELLILEGRYFKDVELNLLEKAKEKKREEAPLPKEGTAPFLENMELDIAVKHRNPFVVDNNMAVLNLAPDLKLYGTLARPLVGGRAEANAGTLFFQNKEFEVKKGVVDFLNPYRIEPSIDVAGDVEVRKWKISLTVSGTPDNLAFKLTSDPHESDGDILSLLAFGKTSRELIKGEGGSSKSTRQILAGMVADTLQENIKDAVGLDIIRIQYGEGAEEGDKSDINITLGKELSRGLTVKYGMERKGNVTVQKAITEYKFLENLLMNAFNDTEGDFGGELLFRLEFR